MLRTVEPADETSMVLPPLNERETENANVCREGPNLVCSSASDDEASCLIMSVEVPASYTTAYDAWTRFELPYFMKGVEMPSYHDGGRMTWRVRTLFDQFAWQARVCDVSPSNLIAWKSIQGAPHPNFGSVSFEPMSDHRTWILVKIGFEMSGVYRCLGDPLPSISQSLERSLLRFHDFMTVQTLVAEPQTAV